MLLEFVGGVLAQFDDIFHALVAVDVDALFSAAIRFLLEMAGNDEIAWHGSE